MASKQVEDEIGEPFIAENIEEEEFLSIDEVLQRWAGEFGSAQLIHFVLVSFAWTVESIMSLVTVFSERKPEWHCVGDTSKCAALSFCDLDPALWEWTNKQISTVSEWDLVCSNEYKLGLAGSAYFLGAMFGAGLLGSLSDSFLGRKGVIKIACTLSVVCTLLTSMASNYWMYFTFRVLTGFSTGSLGLTSFVLATEPIGPSKRGFVGMCTFYLFSFGYMILPALSYLSSSWRQLYVICSIPGILYLALMLPFVDESPRWFLVQGRIDECMNSLRKFAKNNGRNLPNNVSLRLEANPCKEENSKTTSTLWDALIYSETRKRIFLISFIWFVITITYYGISLNVSNIGFNLYLGAFLNATAELPGYVLTAKLLGKYGRRSMLAGCLFFSGMCCIFGAMVAGDSGLGEYKGTAQLICGIMCLLGLAGTYNLIYIFAAELFPTSVRNAALGVGKQAGQSGAIMAPLIVALGRRFPVVPFGLFGIAASFAGALTFFLPETKDQPVFDTLHGLRNYRQYEEFVV